MPKISVIIPVYNGQKYLEQCITSVLEQSYSDFELIIVNDGSTDDSLRIMNKYKKADNRVRVYSHDNQGLITTRICGLKEAQGTYIAFLDADDWWDREFLQSLISAAEPGNYDLVAGGCIKEYEEKKEQIKNNIPCGIYQGTEQMLYIQSKMLHFDGFFRFGILPYMWNKLFKADLLKKTYQHVDIRITDGEDVACVMPYIAEAKSIRVIDDCLYHYRMHSQQMTANKGVNFYENVSLLYLNLKDHMKQKVCYELFLPQLDQYMRYMIWMGNPESFPQKTKYPFPYEKVPRDSRIILYAAGNVGQAYYRQLQETKYCKIAAWVDREKEGTVQESIIEAPEVIWERDFDYIVVAIENLAVRNKVKEWLRQNGITAETII